MLKITFNYAKNTIGYAVLAFSVIWSEKNSPGPWNDTLVTYLLQQF